MNRWTTEIINTLLIVCGIFSAAMGLKGFLLPLDFIDGGVTGISMLLAATTYIPLSVWLPLVNIPFLFVAWKRIGFLFALRSALAILSLAAVLYFISFPVVTHDPVLTAVFGGIFLGTGIGLAIRGGAVLDGTEIAALLISRRAAYLRVGDVILACNVIIFFVAMWALGVERALYSILTYISAAKTLDYVIYGLEEFTAMTIISAKSPAIREAVTESLGRGVTVFNGFGGKTGETQEILYCVVTRLEIGKVKEIVRACDRAAFVTVHPLAAVYGGTVKKIRRF